MTKIEWVKNPDGSQGYAWNPITGCLNHTNGLCKGGGFPCYAYKLANGRLKQRYLANTAIAPFNFSSYESLNILDKTNRENPFYPRFWKEKLEQLKPPRGDYYYHDYKGIFVCDMSDLFGIGIPKEWTKKVIDKIKDCPQYRFYLLTKQPQNLIKFSPFPENCWVGVTATNSKMLREALMHLEKIEASVKYVSLEPLLEQVYDPLCFLNALPDFLSVIDWLIIGAQTNPYKPPEIAWVREIIEAADKAGIRVFLKDNLRPLLPKEPPFYTKPCADIDGKDLCYEEPCLSGHDIDECSKAIQFWRLRQEMPDVPIRM
jgi:protein gp37